MAQERGKRRTKSQRYGEKGEAIFRKWAIDQSLSPSKIESDYGIDFLCMCLKAIGNGSEEFTGKSLAVQVRSTGKLTRPRIKITRVDAVNIMRVRNPFCLIGIDLNEDQLCWRFLDEAFLLELWEFLQSEKSFISLRLERLESDSSLFRVNLESIIGTGYQNRLQITKVELQVKKEIPGGQISITQSSLGSLSIVSVPWLTQVWAIPDDDLDAARKAVFQMGTLPDLELKPVLDLAGQLSEGKLLIQGIFEAIVPIKVEYQGVQREMDFQLRRLGDERAYVHEIGLILGISDPRQRDHAFVHHIFTQLFLDGAKSLGENADALPFFELLKPGATVNLGSSEMKIETLGDLKSIGPALEQIRKVVKQLDFALDTIYLADIQEKEFALTMVWLDAMIIQGVGLERMFPGLILEEEGGNIQLRDGNWQKIGFRLPVVANLKERGVVLWIKGEGGIYEDHGQVIGIRVSRQTSFEYEVTPAGFEKSDLPEVWIHPSWPGVPVVWDKKPPKTFPVRIEGQRALQGDIWLLQ